MIKDTGADPIDNGMFKMYPSGDIVNFSERMKRLPPPPSFNGPKIFGAYSSEEIYKMQMLGKKGNLKQ